jgi:4-hydroxythreonine-4-phosphate dehydrogenase
MIHYIQVASDLAIQRRIAAMVTCPINKTAMQLAGFPYNGHTELLAERTKSDNYAMMFAGDRLRVVLATIHVPLRDVPSILSKQKILRTIKLTWQTLQERFGVKTPRIAVAGLNPHAGESGMFGNEEKDIIAPAIAQARNEGVDVVGPLPPDTLFYHAAKGRYDVVVSMYHDQGLIPFKLMHFNNGVNVTIGLPIIRTSVDHGTAYDIAGTGIADPGSLIAAINMAVQQAAYASKKQ